MTPKTSSSSDGSSLPPRHRPIKSDIIKDSTEQDLWDFDEAAPPDEESLEPAPKSGRALGIPIPRGFGNVKSHTVGGFAKSEESLPPFGPETAERIQLNVSKKRTRAQPVAHPAHHSKAGFRI